METLNMPATKSLTDLTSAMGLRKTNDKLRMQNEINRMMDLQSVINAKVSGLELKLPSIIEALDSMGLGIAEFGYGKTGIDWDEVKNDEKMEAAMKAGLRVNITAVPTSNKFRFIKDQGFTSGGRGKNQNRLDEKSEKMATVIKEKTGIESVSVNPFSLEVKNENDVKRVLIELYIK